MDCLSDVEYNSLLSSVAAVQAESAALDRIWQSIVTSQAGGAEFVFSDIDKYNDINTTTQKLTMVVAAGSGQIDFDAEVTRVVASCTALPTPLWYLVMDYARRYDFSISTCSSYSEESASPLILGESKHVVQFMAWGHVSLSGSLGGRGLQLTVQGVRAVTKGYLDNLSAHKDLVVFEDKMLTGLHLQALKTGIQKKRLDQNNDKDNYKHEYKEKDKDTDRAQHAEHADNELKLIFTPVGGVYPEGSTGTLQIPKQTLECFKGWLSAFTYNPTRFRQHFESNNGLNHEAALWWDNEELQFQAP